MHEIQPRVIGACAIVVGDTELTPTASHLFALLLAFSLVPQDPWTRRGLQELLFAGTEERLAAHRLRQLLYRLRSFGVQLQEESSGVIRLVNPVADPLDLLDADDLVAPPRSSVRLDPLALYSPRMPAPFLDWLEQRRDELRAALAGRRVGALRAARQRQDWPACARMAAALHVVDSIDEEVVLTLAESSAMLGRRDAALDTIDQFLRDTGDTLDARPALKRLRARIASTRIPRREGTLRGRTDALAFLAEQWDSTLRGGGGRVSLIHGAPGIGKSRVGEVFAASTRLGGAQVIQFRCDTHARQSPLAIFTQLVPDLRRRRGSIGADPALAGALDLIAPGPVASDAPIGTAAERRDEVKRAIVDLLEAVSAEQPLLLVVDDAHLLDEASRSVIRWLTDSTNAAQVLVLLLGRPRPDGQTLISASPRFGSYTLPPLDAADSQALLLELSEPRPLTPAQLEWAIREAGGNAFYLHALAQHPSESVALPAHIRSLAETSYMGVSPDARTVLDSCFLLDSLATPGRVAHVAALDDRTLLAAVRELEDVDLLRYEDGLFTGPHAIIREVLDDVMPTTARAVLHHRIAKLLSAECADPGRDRAIGWAAVLSWLACGDPVEAAELALRLARQAAVVGEPEVGAVLLSQIPQDALSTQDQRTVLDTIIELSEAGKCLTLLQESLRQRRDLAILCEEGSSAVARLTYQLASSEISSGMEVNLGAFTRIARDPDVVSTVRADAITRLLVDADLRFESTEADRLFAELQALPGAMSGDPAVLRGMLVYHTTFGSTVEASKLTGELIATVPRLSLDSEHRKAYSYAVLALSRLGRYEACLELAEYAWRWMDRHNHLVGSEYFAGVACQAHMNLGNIAEVERFLRQLRLRAERRGAREHLVISGIWSIDVLIGIAAGDPDRAERALRHGRQLQQTLSSPRFRELSLAHELRIAQLRGDDAGAQIPEELRELFSIGRARGAQDAVAEALWHALTLKGDSIAASEHLNSYLATRREIGPAEAHFAMSTALDPAWKSMASQDLPPSTVV